LYYHLAMANVEVSQPRPMVFDGSEAVDQDRLHPEFQGYKIVRQQEPGRFAVVFNGASLDFRNCYLLGNREIIDRYLLSTGDTEAIQAYSAELATALFDRGLLRTGFSSQDRVSGWNFVEKHGGDWAAKRFIMGLCGEDGVEDERSIKRAQRFVSDKGGDETASEFAYQISAHGNRLKGENLRLAWEFVHKRPEIAAKQFALFMRFRRKKNTTFMPEILDIIKSHGTKADAYELGLSLTPDEENGIGREYHGVVLDIIDSRGGDAARSIVVRKVAKNILHDENREKGWEIIESDLAGKRTAIECASCIGDGDFNDDKQGLDRAIELVSRKGGKDAALAYARGIRDKYDMRIPDYAITKILKFIREKGKSKFVLCEALFQCIQENRFQGPFKDEVIQILQEKGYIIVDGKLEKVQKQ
jgi:hypothetical protein